MEKFFKVIEDFYGPFSFTFRSDDGYKWRLEIDYDESLVWAGPDPTALLEHVCINYCGWVQ